MLVTDATAGFLAAARDLVAADADTPSPAELVECYADIETAIRMVPAVGHALLSRLDREAAPTDRGASSWTKVLIRRLRISKGDAQKRLRWARLLGPRRTLTGDVLAPHLEHTAAVLADGLIGDDHVQVIKDFITALPDRVDLATRIECERTLADLAPTLDPTQLGKVADKLAGYVNPDGKLTDDDRQRRRGMTLGKQQPDGMSRLAGWITPEFRAFLEPLLITFGKLDPTDPSPTGDAPAPDTADPPDRQPIAESPPDTEATPEGVAAPPASDQPSGDDTVASEPDAAAERDAVIAAFSEPVPATDRPAPMLDDLWRNTAQRTHDAMMIMARMLLCSRTLGQLNGLPVSVVVTTTLQELERGAGYALTAGGSRLPMPELIRMAAHAHHYLAVFDEHTAAALYLGRTQRCATGAQKLMLFARDRGCTCPGCDAAGYATQAHHGVADWKHNGQTNIDDLTLACGPDNLMVDTTEWTTHRRPDGVFEWIPPSHLDTGQPRINYTHHPERLLTPEDDDPP